MEAKLPENNDKTSANENSELDLSVEVVPATRSFAAFGRFDPVQQVRTVPRQEVRQVNGVAVESGTPLAYLMDLMESEAPADYSPEQRLYHDRMRLEAAKAALPAVHARLAQVELGGRVTLTHEQALEALERGE